MTNKSEWISTKERLPEQNCEVIAYVKDNDYHKFFVTDFIYLIDEEEGDEWIFNYNDYLPGGWEILYWMPFPDLPTDRKEETKDDLHSEWY